METDLQTREIVLDLVRRGLGFPGEMQIPVMDDAEWKAVLDAACKQAVTGLVYAGLNTLDGTYHVPSDTAFLLVALMERTEQKARKLESVSKALMERLEQEGWHPVLMKGPSIACLYPQPYIRESGDIDLYIPHGEWEAFISGHKEVGNAPDGSLQWTEEGIPVDLHPNYFDLHLPESKLPPVPSAEATLLMLSVHILKHCMTSGIGLKQLCDMAVAYNRLEYDRQALIQYYKQTGTLSWNRLLAAFLARHYKGTNLPFDVDSLPSPRPLEKIVFSGGNFGQYASGRRKRLEGSAGSRKIDTALRMLGRLPFSLKYAPGEWFRYVGTLLRNQ